MDDKERLCNLLRQLIEETKRAADNDEKWFSIRADKLIEQMDGLWKSAADLNFLPIRIFEGNMIGQPCSEPVTALEIYSQPQRWICEFSAILESGPRDKRESAAANDLLAMIPYVEKWIEWLELEPPRVTVESFKCTLAFVAGAQTRGTERADIRRVIEKEGAQLLQAAVEAGLGDWGMSGHDTVHRVIRWAVANTEATRAKVLSWTVVEAINRLTTNGDLGDSDADNDPNGALEESLRVSISEDGKTWTWGETEFPPFSDRAARAVRAIYDATLKGRGLESRRVRAAAESDCKNVRDVFKMAGNDQHAAWGTMIIKTGNAAKTLYWIQAPNREK